MDERRIAVFEVVLMVVAIFSFAYFVGFAYGHMGNFSLKEKYERFISTMIGDGRVSAISVNDLLQQGVQQFTQQINEATGGGFSICKETKDGKKCMLYPTSQCQELCKTSGDCVQIALTSSDSIDEDALRDAGCALGTCQDTEHGVCAPNSFQGGCDTSNGFIWYEGVDERTVQACKKGCCILGTEARLMTELECNRTAAENGLEYGTDNANFDSTINDELVCSLVGQRGVIGACTYGPSVENPGKNDCRRTTQDECLSLTGINPTTGVIATPNSPAMGFHEGELCSNPNLNTTCTPHNYTSCVDGLDEVFWFDSCGNQENIFDASRAADSEYLSKMIPKDQLCQMGTESDPLANQETCGNCNRIFSSMCGNASEEGKKLVNPDGSNPKGDVICADLRCRDPSDNNRIRENGETWCAYQTKFGVMGFDGNILGSLGNALPFTIGDTTTQQSDLGEDSSGGSVGSVQISGGSPFSLIGGIGGLGIRSIAPPGSLYFRKSCQDGNIEITSCANYRNEICTETQAENPDTGKTYSVAACRMNRWQECLNYNPKQQSGSGLDKVKMMEAMGKCMLDPDCFVKYVNVEDTPLKYPICLPKYPPGFDQSSDGQQGANGVCGFGTNKCVAVFVKKSAFLGLGGCYWECVANCGCVAEKKTDPNSAQPSRNFVQEMNNLCTSLGDCGTKVNYKGGIPGGLGFEVKRCVSESAEDCENGKAAMGMQAMMGAMASSAMTAMDIIPTPGAYIHATDACTLQNSIGASLDATGDMQSLVQSFIGDGSTTQSVVNPDGTLNDPCADQTGSGGTGSGGEGGDGSGSWIRDKTSIGGYSGKELPWVGGIAGASALGIYAGAQAGLIPATVSLGTTTIVPATMSAELGSVTSGVYASGGEIVAPAATVPFAAPLIGGAIGLAVTGLLIAVTGIGRGLGAAGSYTLMGMGAVSGGMIGYAVAKGGVAALTSTSTAAGAIGVIGVVLAVVVIIIIIINVACGAGEIKYVHFTYECQAWQRPLGGAMCNKCGENGFLCNNYACQSLGGTCELFGDEPNIICEDTGRNDVSGPEITPWEEAKSDNILYASLESGRGFKIERVEEPKCITQFEPIQFGIKLDEHGRCKIGSEPMANYDEMADFGDTGGILQMNHTMRMNSLDILAYLGEGETLEPNQEKRVTLYVKCEDANGNPSAGDFAIEMCVIGKDLTPPFIQSPEEGTNYLRYDVTDHQVTVNSNEPVELRWAYEDIPYDQMTNLFDCPPEKALMQCTANIPLQGEETRICVKGRDHPELKGTEREGERNTKEQCLWITLLRAGSALQVLNVKPNETIVVGTTAAQIQISAETVGGVDGTATCKYSLDMEALLMFNDEDGGTMHTAHDVRQSAGNHIIDVICQDDAGHQAANRSSYHIDIDLIPPNITRIYSGSGTLFVVTNEFSECALVTTENADPQTPCMFTFESPQVLKLNTGVDGKTHSADFNDATTYYIKCKDRFENMNATNECAIVARGVWLN